MLLFRFSFANDNTSGVGVDMDEIKCKYYVNLNRSLINSPNPLTDFLNQFPELSL